VALPFPSSCQEKLDAQSFVQHKRIVNEKQRERAF